MTVPPVSGYVVSPLQNGLLPNQNANFLANEGQTTRCIHPQTRNDNNALNEIYQPTYPVAQENQAALGEGYQAENTLFISNQTSDDDSLTDSTERNRDRAVGISSSRRHKVKAVSSMRVFVTGGSCADEMKRIKLDLRWIEQLGVSVDWDDGDILEVGTGKWIKIFNSANLVLIGVTKSYVTNVKNRDWLPRAAKINEVVQNERLHFEGNNKRFMNIVFTQTGLKKSELRSELKFAIYCFPGSKGELETSLRKKLR
ncbi:uncharacterized protein LOC135468800 isoform X2 [Liolophura sinensis]|uniref:uncharacterized protein LOC135468800 isoform X2 n=1 Tax=Liolophura sinensis TaxID=3198878 RepID=UPI0031595C45